MGFELHGESFIDGDHPKSDETSSTISSCLTGGFQYQGSERGLLICFSDTDLTTAKKSYGSQRNKPASCSQAWCWP
uniref:Uncharacterized protein n=1 Tax=Arundo donax TaxID=35708 RepID=A0A0A9DG99_ARUDO